MSESAQTASPFSARVVAILIAVAAISFGAVLVMAGWAPELRDRNQAGDHPYSTSALGYNGLVRLMESAGYPVERVAAGERSGVARLGADDPHAAGLWQSRRAGRPQPAGRDAGGAAEMVGADRRMNRRGRRTHSSSKRAPERRTELDLSGCGNPARAGAAGALETPFGNLVVKPDVVLQLIRDPSLETIIGFKGGALLAYDESRALYILSDPDLMNTFGLAQRENARFALQLVDYLRTYPDEPILLDATLHGFERSENLLKMMFSVPYIGVTLVALAAALLLGWAATASGSGRRRRKSAPLPSASRRWPTIRPASSRWRGARRGWRPASWRWCAGGSPARSARRAR
jgi:hypothetical protein